MRDQDDRVREDQSFGKRTICRPLSCPPEPGDSLKELNEIEIALNEIKANSKQDYLRQEHKNFSRVIHDYSDMKSGFTAWKGMLEEKLV